MTTPTDYRIRKTPRGFYIWQRVGPGWERLENVYPSRREAHAALTEFSREGDCHAD